MNYKIMHNKKGFSLVECVVALLLFSIVTSSVLTIFSISRNQIKKQNMKYKSDMLQSNIIAAYEASNDYSNMANILGWATKEADETPTVPVVGASGNGSIPVPVQFDKITVDNGFATFSAKDKKPDGKDAGTYSDIMLFENDYANNKLTAPAQIPADYYTETPIKIPREMILEGQSHPTAEGLTGAYDYTLTINESDVSLKMGKGEATKPATDLDKYLLKNAEYLKCIKNCDYRLEKTSSGFGIFQNYTYTIYGNLYFEVYSAVNPKAPKKYYCVSLNLFTASIPLNLPGNSTIEIMNNLKNYFNIDIGFLAQNSLNTTLQNFYNGSLRQLNTYLDLSDCTIKEYTGDSCPDASGFTEELKADGFNFKTGKWYFVPWLAARDDAQYVPTCTKFEPGKTYYEYTPKSGKASNIYYILTSGGEVKLFDSNSVNIFSFDSTATKATESLATATSHCNITQSTTTTYQEKKYSVWYLKGSMPEKTVKKIVFTDSKEITVYSSDNKPFIRFIYNNANTYKADKNSIKTGAFKSFFTVYSNTATIKSPGTVYFTCAGFAGPYSIKINDTVIFTSNTGFFEIKDADPTNTSGISFGMIGEPVSESANAKTYYTSCVVNDSDTSLIAKITFSDLAKPKIVDGKTVEPEIRIWSIKTSEIPANIKTIETNPKATLERTYRKG